MRSVRFLMFFAIALVAAACSGGAGGGGGDVSSTDRYALTMADLQPYATLNAYEAIQRLRRFWIQGSGGRSPRVFVNGAEMGGAPSLQEYQTTQIAGIVFLQPTEAMTQFGPDYAGGVIQVTLR